MEESAATKIVVVVGEEEESAGKKNLVGEEAIGKKIRIFDEGCVVSVNNVDFTYLFERNFNKGCVVSVNNVDLMYLFERGDDGRLEPLYLKDQMMELGIVEKEEDMIGKRIRVYDEGVVINVPEKKKIGGMHTVKLDDGRLRELVLDDYDYDYDDDDDNYKTNIEWEQEWHLRKSDQLAAVKRIRIPISELPSPFINEDIINEDKRFRRRSERQQQQQRSFDYIN